MLSKEVCDHIFIAYELLKQKKSILVGDTHRVTLIRTGLQVLNYSFVGCFFHSHFVDILLLIEIQILLVYQRK